MHILRAKLRSREDSNELLPGQFALSGNHGRIKQVLAVAVLSYLAQLVHHAQ